MDQILRNVCIQVIDVCFILSVCVSMQKQRGHHFFQALMVFSANYTSGSLCISKKVMLHYHFSGFQVNNLPSNQDKVKTR